ncbi:MAG: hypothetical protein ACOY5V_01110 [Pseudomonadota bacterium]
MRAETVDGADFIAGLRAAAEACDLAGFDRLIAMHAGERFTVPRHRHRDLAAAAREYVAAGIDRAIAVQRLQSQGCSRATAYRRMAEAEAGARKETFSRAPRIETERLQHRARGQPREPRHANHARNHDQQRSQAVGPARSDQSAAGSSVGRT